MEMWLKREVENNFPFPVAEVLWVMKYAVAKLKRKRYSWTQNRPTNIVKYVFERMLQFRGKQKNEEEKKRVSKKNDYINHTQKTKEEKKTLTNIQF